MTILQFGANIPIKGATCATSHTSSTTNNIRRFSRTSRIRAVSSATVAILMTSEIPNARAHLPNDEKMLGFCPSAAQSTPSVYVDSTSWSLAKILAKEVLPTPGQPSTMITGEDGDFDPI